MSTSAVSSSKEADAPQQTVGRLRILQVSGSAAGGVRTHLADCARILAADGHAWRYPCKNLTSDDGYCEL